MINKKKTINTISLLETQILSCARRYLLEKFLMQTLLTVNALIFKMSSSGHSQRRSQFFLFKDTYAVADGAVSSICSSEIGIEQLFGDIETYIRSVTFSVNMPSCMYGLFF